MTPIDPPDFAWRRQGDPSHPGEGTAPQQGLGAPPVCEYCETSKHVEWEDGRWWCSNCLDAPVNGPPLFHRLTALDQLVRDQDDRSLARDRDNNEAIGRCTDAIVRLDHRLTELENNAAAQLAQARRLEPDQDLTERVLSELLTRVGTLERGTPSVLAPDTSASGELAALRERIRVVGWLLESADRLHAVGASGPYLDAARCIAAGEHVVTS